MNKVCGKCRRELPIEEFNWKVKAKGRRQSYCKRCQSAATKSHYKRNPGPYKERALENRWNSIHVIHKYLSENPCIDCGNSDIRVLDFDHRNPEGKKFNIGKAAHSGYGKETLMQEIAKCDVRCKNCHAIRHEEESPGWRSKPL